MDEGALQEGLVVHAETGEPWHVGPRCPMEGQAIAGLGEALSRKAAIARTRRVGEAGEDDRAARMGVGRGGDGSDLEVDRAIARTAIKTCEDRLIGSARQPALNLE